MPTPQTLTEDLTRGRDRSEDLMERRDRDTRST
jgi:hypothetical protein